MAFDPDFGRVVPTNVKLMMGGGWRDGESVSGIPHQGVDIILSQGTPILAAAEGVATFVGPASDAGNMVVITHPSGLQSRYLHLSAFSVSRGQTVEKGQQIGLSGNTGNSAAPHLHFDLKVPAALAPVLLPQIVAEIGEPKGGFGPNVLNTGIGIPTEPWLPVDGYTAEVVNNAKLFGIPLLIERSKDAKPLLVLAGTGGLLFGAWWFSRKAGRVAR